jgi:transcriptional regulator with XRE-family HTH domain
MPIEPVKIGIHIAGLRRGMRLTQQELGDRLGVTFQSVSKWERGETLPDTALLPELAAALDTTADDILSAGKPALPHQTRKTVAQLREGIDCLVRMGELLGPQNVIFRHAMDGISRGLNTDVDAMLADDYLRECLVAEAALQCLRLGYAFDPADLQNGFRHAHWAQMVKEHAG